MRMHLVAMLIVSCSLAASPIIVTPERPVGVPALTPRGSNVQAQLASNGTISIACWSETRTARSLDIFATRLNAGGGPLDEQGIPVVINRGSTVVRAAVWDGEKFLIVGSGLENGETTFVAEMDERGTVLRIDELFTELNAFPIVAAPRRGGGALLLYNVKGGLVLRTTDGKRRVLDRDGDLPQIVRCGNGFAAIWRHAVQQVVAQHLDENGDAIDAPQVLGVIRAGVTIAAAASGHGALLAYSHMGMVNIFTMTETGRLSAPATEPALNVQSMAAMPDGGFVFTESDADDPYITRFHRFDGSGTVIARPPVGLAAVALTSTGKGVIAVGLRRDRALASYVYGDDKTTPIDITPSLQVDPRLASDGRNALLTWREDDALDVVFVDGRTEARRPVTDIDGYVMVTPGYDGTSFFLLLETRRQQFVQRIASDGSLLGPPLLLGRIDDATMRATAGSTIIRLGVGTLTWTWLQDPYALQKMEAGVGGAAVGTDGTYDMIVMAAGDPANAPTFKLFVIRPENGVRVPIAQPVDVIWPPALSIAGNGREWMITYSTRDGFFAQRLQLDGSPSGPSVFITAPTKVDSVRMVWNGQEFLSTWKNGDGIHVSAIGGDRVETSMIVAMRDQENGDLVNIGGRSLMVYQRRVPEAAYMGRIFTRWVMPERMRPASHETK